MRLTFIFHFIIPFFMLSNLSGQTVQTKNVLNTKLEACCYEPMTGFYRNGYCETGPQDRGLHVVCAIMTQEFLDYTLKLGNDLCTARPQYNFPGLSAGDQWCLCAIRWKEAYEAGVAPLVKLESTNVAALKIVTLEMLKSKEVPTEK